MKPSFADLFLEIAFLIHTRSMHLRRKQPVNFHELHILLILMQEAPLTIRQLQGRLQLAHNTVSELVHHLESLQLVSKQSDLSDRRVRKICITPEGKTVAGKVKNEILRAGEKLFAQVPESQRDIIQQAFEWLVAALRNNDRKENHVR